MPPDFLTTLSIEGTDAIGFLNGQFTTDVAALAPGQGGLSAWCDPKGRAIATFFLVRRKDILLLLPGDMKETFIKRLETFVLRADVVIATPGADAVAPLTPLPGMDPGAPDLALLRRGIPLLHPETSGHFLPQELNLEGLDALSFSKGCYPGQEIIARLRYRGKVKRRLCHATTDNPNPLPPGATLLEEGQERPVGTVINSVTSDQGQELLVVLERPFIETGRIVVKDFPASSVNALRAPLKIGGARAAQGRAATFNHASD